MQDLVLGLEVVLPDGTVWDGLRAVQKDNAGYQLRKLFCGSEGTLGIVTRAVLKLFPAPRRRATALVALADYAAAERMGAQLVAEAGEFISGLEFFSEVGVGLALKHLGRLGFPLGSRAPVCSRRTRLRVRARAGGRNSRCGARTRRRGGARRRRRDRDVRGATRRVLAFARGTTGRPAPR